MSDSPINALIKVPTWDGKIVLAALLIIGYYALVLTVVVGTPAGELTPVRAGVARDALLTLGPPIGLVFGALFRSTGAEERRDAIRSSDFRAALETPGVSANTDLSDDVRDGAEDGTKAGVAAGIKEASTAATNPDRVDRGRFPSIEPIVAPIDEKDLPEYARSEP